MVTQMWVWFYLFSQLTAATDRINSLCEEQHTLKQENEVILQSSQRKEEVSSVLWETYFQFQWIACKHSKGEFACNPLELKVCFSHCCVVWFQVTLQDSQVELETYKQSRQGLDEMYTVVWTQYKEEKRIRQVRYCMLNYNIWPPVFHFIKCGNQTIKWQCCYSLTWRDTVLVAALLVYTVKLHLDPIETVFSPRWMP